MGTTELILLKEFAIPLIFELASRRAKDSIVKKTLSDAAVNPNTIKNLKPEVKTGIIEALADIVEDILHDLGKLLK